MLTSSPPVAASIWRDAQNGSRALSPASGNPAKLIGGAMAAADAGIVVAASAGAYALRHGTLDMPPEIAYLTLLAAVLTINAMHLAGCYTRHVAATLPAQIGRATQGWSTVFVLLLVFVYLTKTSSDLSRAWTMGWYLAVLVGVALVRLASFAKVAQWRRQGKLARTVAVVDLAGTGDDLARRLLVGSAGEMRLVGVFAPEPAPDRRNGVVDLLALARQLRIDEIIVAVPADATAGSEHAANTIVRMLGTIPSNVRICPEVPKIATAPREAGFLFGEPVLTVYRRPLMGWNRVAKRTEDLVLSTVLVVLLAPLLALVAFVIKLDTRGPVLFRQARLGFNNNPITVFKFRSMTHRPAEVTVAQARRNDQRVTRVGKFLRRSSIDELPQLFNVLRGEMSLVGPRPHALAHNEQYAALIDGYLGRHRVQPGITGWAQVNGLRGETETLDKMQRRVEHDIAYIDGWSLSLDLRILFLTPILTIFDRNAY